MEAKRMRFNENILLQNQQQSASPIEFKIWQNRQIEECIDDNFINSFLESTREQITRQNNNHSRLEHQAIDQAIDTMGLKKPSLDDEESSTDSFENYLPTAHINQNSSLEDFAIDSAIKSYGLHKKRF